MIVTEMIIHSDGMTLIHTFSDEGYMIEQVETGNLYSEAVDLGSSHYTYVETDLMIEDDISDEEALRIILGGDTDEQS